MTSIDTAVRYRKLFTRYEKCHSVLNSKDHFDVNKKTELCKRLDTGRFWCWVMHLSKIMFIFTSNGQVVVGESNSRSNTENSSNSIIYKVKFFFSLKSCQRSLLSPKVIEINYFSNIYVLFNTEY